MIYITKHKLMGDVRFLCVTAYEWQTEGESSGWVTAEILFIFLIPILSCEFFAYLGSFGFLELFAKDRRDGLAPSMVATFF